MYNFFFERLIILQAIRVRLKLKNNPLEQNVLDIVPQFAEIFTDEVVEKYTNIALERERYVDKKYAHHQ